MPVLCFCLESASYVLPDRTFSSRQRQNSCDIMNAALLQIAEIAEQNGIEVIDKDAALKIAEIKKKSK